MSIIVSLIFTVLSVVAIKLFTFIIIPDYPLTWYQCLALFELGFVINSISFRSEVVKIVERKYFYTSEDDKLSIANIFLCFTLLFNMLFVFIVGMLFGML